VRRRLRVGGPCATSTGFARFSTSPSRSARSTNKQWQRKYEIGRARGPWDRPTQQGRVDNFSRRVLPLIRVSSSLRSDEAPLAVSIFGVCQRLPLLTGISDNVGGVKHVATTLPHALEQERHFALIGEVLNPTKARFLISIQVGKLSSTHASLRSQARS